MPWMTWLVLAFRVFTISRKYGPEIADVYRAIMEIIHDLQKGGTLPAMTGYFKEQVSNELDNLRAFNSRDPTNLKDLHQQVSAVQERAFKH